MSRDPDKRPKRSAGTVGPVGAIMQGLKYPSQEAIAADLAAVDADITVRLVCLFRGTYGGYPRRFRGYIIDLSGNGVIVRPPWYSVYRKVFRVTEKIEDARVRPRDPKADWNVRAAGAYSEGGSLSYAGFAVISCRTHAGTIEFAVPRPDVQLMLHYLNRRKN